MGRGMSEADNRKYELVPLPGEDRFRVRALRDWTLSDGTTVSKGDIGGYVDGHHNLDQAGRCWIADDASAADTARVTEDAVMSDQATAHGGALLCGRARAFDSARLVGRVVVGDDVWVFGRACVQWRARASGSSRIRDDAKVAGRSHVTDEAEIAGKARMWDSARASRRSRVNGNAVMCEQSHATDDAHVGGEAFLQGEDTIDGDMSVVVRRWREYATVTEFDASHLSADRSAGLHACNAPTLRGRCGHRVRPDTEKCPAGHRPVARS